jgi:hypothetical protein
MAQAAQGNQPNGQVQQGQPNNGNGGQPQQQHGSQNSQGQANHQRRTSTLDLQNEQMDDDQPDPLVPHANNRDDERQYAGQGTGEA